MPKKEEIKFFNKPKKKPAVQKKDSVNRIMLQNFTELQKVMTELSEKFEKLSSQISELLNLFEESAKTLVKKEFEIIKESPSTPNLELNSKLDKILDQNKILAKGLTLIHDKTQPAQQNIYPQQQMQSAYKEEIRKPMINKTEEKPKRSVIEKDDDESPPVFEIP